nr:NADP-dependent isocitrate dehydrogenase [Tessaracoccus sp.]
MKAAVAELQAQGFAIPDYPEDPQTDEERDVRARYSRVMGSAVNPVLREGNSDRRAPGSVKNCAKRTRTAWVRGRSDSKTAGATMDADDFRHNEQSVVMPADDVLTIRLIHEGGPTVLKDGLKVQAGEVVDGTVMRAAALDAFLAAQVARAKAEVSSSLCTSRPP